MTIATIAEHFSTGRFQDVYDLISNDAVWTVVGENEFKGKEAIVRNCEKVGAYFESVTTKFTVERIIASENSVVVCGTAEFIRNRKTVSFISACDVYEFDINGKIFTIKSYCISQKPR